MQQFCNNMYRVIVKYPVCAYLCGHLLQCAIHQNTAALRILVWCSKPLLYYQAKSQSLFDFGANNSMISHDRSSNVDSFCLPFECDLMEFLDLFLKRPLPIICTSIVLFLEIDIIPIPEFFFTYCFPLQNIFCTNRILETYFLSYL